MDMLLWSIRFDLVPLTYITAFVYIWLLAAERKPSFFKRRVAAYVYYLGTSLLFVLALADTIYYHSFITHLNMGVLPWLKDPATVLRMILGSWHLAFMFIPGILLLVIWFRTVKKLFQRTPGIKWLEKSYIPLHLILFVILFFLGKGRIISHPLQSGHAFNDYLFFLNDFKINAFFGIRDSWVSQKEKDLHLMNDSLAVQRVRKMLHITETKYDSPIARDVDFQTPDSLPMNVIVILMERKAAWKMKYFGNKDSMTPFLDSLFLNALSFDRFYSSGTRTFEGLFGSLYAYPVLFSEHPLYGTGNDLPSQQSYRPIKRYYGLPQVLKEKGYTTLFFCPHNPDFDNLITFLPLNGFDKLYGLKNFRPEQKKTSWGVDDPALFDFAIEKLDREYARNRKFLGVIMTITDHEPYFVPDSVKGPNIKIRAARYADLALKRFFRKISDKPWFDHTLFVLFGDHGKPHDDYLPTSLSHHHVPLIFWWKGIKPAIQHRIGDQKDIFPTLMHLLHLPYTNNTLGKDLLQTSLSYGYFNHYQKGAWINDRFLVNINERGEVIGLYDYHDKSGRNIKDSLPQTAEAMADSLRAHLQTSFFIRRHNLQGKPKPARKATPNQKNMK